MPPTSLEFDLEVLLRRRRLVIRVEFVLNLIRARELFACGDVLERHVPMEPLQTPRSGDGALTGARTSGGALGGELDAECPCPASNRAWTRDTPYADGSAGREYQQVECKGPRPLLGPGQGVRSAQV